MMHPSIASILRYFEYEHLPPKLRRISGEFARLAHALVDDYQLTGPELTDGLRNLLRAKDSSVRAALDLPELSWADR